MTLGARKESFKSIVVDVVDTDEPRSSMPAKLEIVLDVVSFFFGGDGAGLVGLTGGARVCALVLRLFRCLLLTVDASSMHCL